MMPSMTTQRQPGTVTYLTEKGLQKLQSELGFLCTTRRQEIADYLHEIMEDSDLAESNEYLLAKDEQALVEGRIRELETLLRHVEIIQPGSIRGVISRGSTVTVQEDEMPSETYTIVGYAEANAREGLISDESPMGRALVGHKVGETVEFAAPDGVLRFRILSVT